MNKLLCALVILSAYFPAQTGASNVDSAEVFYGDFEEATDTNYDAWPDRWTRRRGPGYPAYLPIEIVDDSSRSGQVNRCLQIRLDGGAAEVFAPSIPITPQFSYLLETRVRTEGLKNDVVSFSVAFYDTQDKLLETRESELIRDAKDWVVMRLGPMTPTTDRARSAVLSVHVRPTTSPDLSGTVCIDDVRFARVPKMSVETNNEYNVFTNPRDINITCRVSGFTHANPVITFELLDVFNVKLDEKQETMSSGVEAGRDRTRSNLSGGTSAGVFSGSVSWKPPITEYGFYTVRVSTPGHSGLVENLVVVPPLERGKRGEFGWSLPDGEHPIGFKALPSLLGQAGVHWLKFPVWFSASDTNRAEELASFAERLSTYGIQMVGVLDQPPQALKQFFGATERMASASVFDDKAVWHPALDPVMTRLSLKVHWWQLGRDYDTSFSSYADLNGKIREIRDDLTSFGQQVNVGVPWRTIEEPPDIPQPAWAFLSYVDDLPFTYAEIRSYLDTAATSRSKRWIVLQPLSRQKYDLETRARDLVLQMLAAKIADAKGIFIPNPFDEDRGVLNEEGSPSELLLPWRTAATLIGGGEYIGGIKLPKGSENHIFVRDNRGVMVVWNEKPTTEIAFLGEDIKQYDIWGRQSNPGDRTEGEFIRHEIPVGPMPTFITGVNPAIALWRMNFRFETTSLTSEFGREQTIAYRFKNTFPQGVAGRATVHTPNVWNADGNARQFKLDANEERRDTLRVILGPDANTGDQPLRVDFELTAERNLHFSLIESVQVGLGDVMITLETRLDEEGNLVVEQHLINNTDKLVSFNCLLYAPGRRRDKRQVFNLGRGKSTNNFVLPNGQELLGKTLWLRAEEYGGTRILNDHIVAHD